MQSEQDSRIGPQVLCILLVTLPYLGTVLLNNYYLPNYDETFQLEAAVRLASGKGYTVSWVIPKDLATPTFVYLVAWPIGYSLLISGLLKIGASVGLAAQLVKLAAILLALGAWIHLARRFLSFRSVTATIFCCFTGLFTIVCAISASDLVVLALFPIFSSLLLARPSGSGTDCYQVSSPHRLVLAGGLAGIAVVMKYTALPFVLIGAAWIGWNESRQPRRMLGSLLLFGFPAACLVAAVFLTNYMYGGRVAPAMGLGMLPQGGEWRFEWILDPVMAVFFSAPYLPRAVVKVFFTPLSPTAESVATYVLLIGIAATVAAAVIVLIRDRTLYRQLATWLLAGYLCAVLFLGTTTLLHYRGAGWTPLMEGRYYQWIVPVMLLCVLVAFAPALERFVDRHRVRAASLHTVVLGIFLVSSTIYSVHINRVTNALVSDSQLTFERLQSIRKAQGTAAYIVFVDPENFPPFPQKGEVNVLPVADVFSGRGIFSSGTHFSRQVLIALICTRNVLRHGQQNQNICVAGEFESMAARFGFARENIGARNTLFWKVFAPGPAPLIQ